MDVNVSAVLSLAFGLWEPSRDPAFHGDAPLQLLISPFASHFCILVLKYVVPVYLHERLKSVFQVDDKLAELGCIAV